MSLPGKTSLLLRGVGVCGICLGDYREQHPGGRSLYQADLCTRQISVPHCSGFSLVGGKRSSGAGSCSLRSEQPGLPRSGTAVVESSALPLGRLSLLELTPRANPTALEASGKPPDGRLPAVRDAQEQRGHPCWGCPTNRRGGSEPANILSKREQGRKIRMA